LQLPKIRKTKSFKEKKKFPLSAINLKANTKQSIEYRYVRHCNEDAFVLMHGASASSQQTSR